MSINTKQSLATPVVAALLAMGVLGLAALLVWPYAVGFVTDVCNAALPGMEERCSNSPNKLIGYVTAIGFFPIALIIERLNPAAPDQGLFSVGLLNDFFWFCCAPIFLVLFVVPVEGLLSWVYYGVLGLEKVTLISTLPVAAQIVVVILVSDFTLYCAHFLRHKVALIWEFHQVHHSQEQMNVFTTSRIHPGDFIAIALVRFLPFAALDLRVAVPAFVGWTVVSKAYEVFTHSNVRTNLGPLKYVLVTPQSHRVHHSARPEHQDKNFGTMFSIWDFIFGTQCLDFDVYPETGVPRRNVPLSSATSLSGNIMVVLKQLIYPLQSMREKIAARSSV
jgi:sterol desaturase/sphingolipid hydroxylase (fatty acid hydroxylase superfamily)